MTGHGCYHWVTLQAQAFQPFHIRIFQKQQIENKNTGENTYEK